MFSRILNHNGNTYFEYDFGGKPFRYVEVRSVSKELNEARWRLTLENDKFYRQIVRNWSECVTLSRYFSPREVRDLHYHGVTPEGYSLHHIHPRALGGNTLELSNMVLISRELHDKLHDFMRDFIIAKCLPLRHLTAPIPNGKKIFMAVPILPPVVRAQDISFANSTAGFTKDLQLAKKIIFEYLKTESKSQIIVTTHNDGLLDLIDDLIRKDSVWFTEKNRSGVTDLYKLTDFRGVNRLSSIREAYRNKRFGATMR